MEQRKIRYRVYWETVDLGWVSFRDQADGVIRQHLARRRRGQHDRAYKSEYRIVEESVSQCLT